MYCGALLLMTNQDQDNSNGCPVVTYFALDFFLFIMMQNMIVPALIPNIISTITIDTDMPDTTR